MAQFYFNLEKEILKLQSRLLNNRYIPSTYRYFTIHDPKKRQIAVAPFKDRVVHHALVNMLDPLFEKRFIFDSYASRKGKGTHKAIERAQSFVRRRPWYVKIDIEKYFASIDHGVLMKLIQKKVTDTRVFFLAQTIIDRSDTQGKGLPIGNLTSQFFANVYLDVFDHYIKDGLGVKCYLRYMDDFLIFGWSKEQVSRRLDKARNFLGNNLGLGINPKALCMGQSKFGVNFLGMGTYPGTIRVSSKNKKRSLKRIKHKIKLWQTSDLEDVSLISSMNSVFAHLKYFTNIGYDTDWGA